MARTARKVLYLGDAHEYERRARIFQTLADSLAKYSSAQRAEIAIEAGVSPTTLYNWARGHTRRPQLSPIIRVAYVLGYEATLVKKKARLTRVK